MDEPKVPVADTPEQAEKEIEKEVAEQTPDQITEKPNFLKKAWHFIWEEESILSYVVFIIIAFVILKFLVFPAVLFVTGYSDIAAVVSSSMDHDSGQIDYTFNSELEFHEYAQEDIDTWQFLNGLDVGDVILVKSVPAEEIHVGDVILFYAPQGQIIHRVVEVKQIGDGYFYTTKGDANVASLTIEQDIPYSEVKGKLVKKIPFLGYPKVALTYVIPWS